MDQIKWCPHCGSDSIKPHGSRWDHKRDKKELRFRCGDCNRTTVNPLDAKPEENVFEALRRPWPEEATKFVITCAQNATKPHRPFLKALKHYCKENGAELIVIPIRYKNPTSMWTKTGMEFDWWDDDLLPYMCVDRVKINDNLILLGDIRTQLTAQKPLGGFETITGDSWGILGHPKLQFTSIASPAHKVPKIMTTTGAVTTDDNYIDSKAGKKGQFHHTIGACVVEVDGDINHIRQINALKNGSFIDLDKKYTKDGVSDAPRAAALVMGDTHAQFVDGSVVNATFEADDGIVKTLQPKQLVFHDVLDFYSQNWHDRNNPFIRYGKHKANMDEVETEVRLTLDFIDGVVPDDTKAIIVPSNHNEGLSRWIREHDWKNDPKNMRFYLETALAMLDSTQMADTGVTTIDPFRHWAEQQLQCDYLFLNRDDPHVIQGIECGFHGDQGTNGAKGSVETFRKIAAKSIIGHFHWPAISEGCYQVGTNSKLKLQYNTGPSSWMHADCVIYANGKRSLIMIQDGRWRG